MLLVVGTFIQIFLPSTRWNATALCRRLSEYNDMLYPSTLHTSLHAHITLHTHHTPHTSHSTHITLHTHHTQHTSPHHHTSHSTHTYRYNYLSSIYLKYPIASGKWWCYYPSWVLWEQSPHRSVVTGQGFKIRTHAHMYVFRTWLTHTTHTHSDPNICNDDHRLQYDIMYVMSYCVWYETTRTNANKFSKEARTNPQAKKK